MSKLLPTPDLGEVEFKKHPEDLFEFVKVKIGTASDGSDIFEFRPNPIHQANRELLRDMLADKEKSDGNR